MSLKETFHISQGLSQFLYLFIMWSFHILFHYNYPRKYSIIFYIMDTFMHFPFLVESSLLILSLFHLILIEMSIIAAFILGLSLCQFYCVFYSI